MKRIFYASIMILAAVVAGCSKENLSNDIQAEKTNTEKVTLTVKAVTKAPALSDAATKVSYGAQDAAWEEGDKIFLIKSDGTTITLTLTEGAGSAEGNFTSTDPVAAGSYIPYAVSASSLGEGLVSVSGGVITLNLAQSAGSTLADALKHDVLKGQAVTLDADQQTAEITGLTNHILSYVRVRFTSESKAIESIGLNSAGGLNQTVTIAANGTVTGSEPSTAMVSAEASDAGAGTYAAYFAVYGKTATSLMASAADADGKTYSRLISSKEVTYSPGLVYGKGFVLSEAMVSSASSGSLSNHNWKDLGLSVKWAEFNVGSTSEYSYDRNIGNTEGESAVPADWQGWRHPTRAEVLELFHASSRQWVTGVTNGVRFDCNGNYLAMGAGGRYRWRDDGNDWEYNVGSEVCFYIVETTSGGVNGTVRVWTQIGSQGNSIGFGSSNLGNNLFYYGNSAAMRLVCDY